MTCTLRRIPDSAIDALNYAPEIIEEIVREVPADEQLNLDKAWHGLHFLLSADIDDYSLLGFLLDGGDPVGEVDVGYGPARTIPSMDVEALDEELSAVTEDQLRARFDPSRMLASEIYPVIWDRDPAEDDTLGWLVAYLAPLQQLVSAAAQAKQGLLIRLS